MAHLAGVHDLKQDAREEESRGVGGFLLWRGEVRAHRSRSNEKAVGECGAGLPHMPREGASLFGFVLVRGGG